MASSLLQAPWRRAGLLMLVRRSDRGSGARRPRQLRVVAFKKFSPVGGLERWRQGEEEQEVLVDLLLSYPAVYGTAAVVLGSLLHLPLAGGFHWSAADAWLGLQLAAPILLLDLPVMDLFPSKDEQLLSQLGLPEEDSVWEGEEEAGDGQSELSAHICLALEQQGHAASGGQALELEGGLEDGWLDDDDDEDLDSILGGEEEVPPHPLQEALRSLREAYSYQGVGLGLSLPSHLALIGVHHLAEEMLWRGVLLGGLSKGLAGALYAAGAEDWVGALGGWGLQVPEVAAAAALACAVTWSAAAAFRREWAAVHVFDDLSKAGFLVDMDVGSGQQGGSQDWPVQAAEEEVEEVAGHGSRTASSRHSGRGGEEGVGEKEDWNWVEHRAWLASFMRQERGYAGAIEALREGTATACLGAAFLLTGNLLAPYVAALAADLAFTAYQVSKREEALAGVQFWDEVAMHTQQIEEEERQEKLARLGLAPRPVPTGDLGSRQQGGKGREKP